MRHSQASYPYRWQKMKGQTRNKMIFGAIDLLRRRGLNATSVREVVKHSNTPRGSVRHHFPDGKQQLISEAMRSADELVTQLLKALIEDKGPTEGVLSFIDSWKDILRDNDYEAGCPILAVCVEQYIGDDGAPDTGVQRQFLDIAEDAFSGWQAIIAAALESSGVDSLAASRRSRLIIAAMEGAIVMCRSSRDPAPLDDIKTEIGLLLGASQH